MTSRFEKIQISCQVVVETMLDKKMDKLSYTFDLDSLSFLNYYRANDISICTRNNHAKFGRNYDLNSNKDTWLPWMRESFLLMVN